MAINGDYETCYKKEIFKKAIEGFWDYQDKLQANIETLQAKIETLHTQIAEVTG